MSEIGKNTQGQKPKISKLAIASVSLGVLGVLTLAWRILFYRPWWSEYVARNIVGLSGIVGLILGYVALARISKRIAAITLLVLLCPFLLFLCSLLLYVLTRSTAGYHFLQQCSFFLSLVCPVGLLIGVVVLEWKSRSREKFKDSTFAIFGLVLTVFLSVFWWMETCGPVSTALRMACGSNLSRLGKAMLIYANDNRGHYPEPNQWCDLILKHEQVDMERFYCPGVKFRWKRQVLPWPVPKNERCYYAMNPNCEPNSPPDVVLLFETKGGRNQFGGQEILTLENHRGDGCNILFDDGHVEFVRAKRIGELKWEVKEETKAEAEDVQPQRHEGIRIGKDEDEQ